MRRAPLLAALSVLTLAPAADACTLNNCAEVRVAQGRHAGGLVAECVVAGRVPQGFAVEGAAVTPDTAQGVAVRCRAFARGVLVYDNTATGTAVATLAATFTSGPDVIVCVTASSGAQTVSDCS